MLAELAETLRSDSQLIEIAMSLSMKWTLVNGQHGQQE
jgi:hypothetical protein